MGGEMDTTLPQFLNCVPGEPEVNTESSCQALGAFIN